MNYGLKTTTCHSAADTYRDTMSVLGETWKSEAEGKVFSQPRVLNLAPKIAFTGYHQPVFEADGSVVAQKAGLDSYAVEVVRIRPDGHEQKLIHYSPAAVLACREALTIWRWDCL